MDELAEERRIRITRINPNADDSSLVAFGIGVDQISPEGEGVRSGTRDGRVSF